MGGAGICAERPGGARRDGSGMACPGRVRQGRFGAWWRFRESSRFGNVGWCAVGQRHGTVRRGLAGRGKDSFSIHFNGRY